MTARREGREALRATPLVVLTVLAAVCCPAEAKSSKTFSPTVKKVIDVYAQWLRGPELIDGLFVPAKEGFCTEGVVIHDDKKKNGVYGCAKPTRVIFMTAVGYWVVFLTLHSLSHRLLVQYRKEWDIVRKVAWNSGLTCAAAALYLGIHAVFVVRKGKFKLEAGSRIMAVRDHDLDFLMAYCVGFHIFEIFLAAVNWALGSAWDRSTAYASVIETGLCMLALSRGEGGAIPLALMVLGLVIPALKVAWILPLTGARQKSMAVELWTIFVTMMVLLRACLAVAIAAKAADNLDAEVRQASRARRQEILSSLIFVGSLIVMWVVEARQMLRKLGGAAVVEDTAAAAAAKKKKDQ